MREARKVRRNVLVKYKYTVYQPFTLNNIIVVLFWHYLKDYISNVLKFTKKQVVEMVYFCLLLEEETS